MSDGSSPTNSVYTVRVRNTGSRVWRKDGSTPLHLGTWNPQDRIPDLVREDTVTHQPSGWSAPNRVTMRDQTVNPGAEATFDFWMSAPTDHQTGSFLQDFRLVMDNIDYGWFGPVIRWQVSITQGNVYAGEVVYKSPDPVIPRLGSARFEVRVKNTGTATWNRDQRVIVNLGTSNPRDRVPPFVREDTVGGSPSGWRAPNRVVMQEGTVAPGQTATFVFWMSALADKQLGLDRQHFELVAEDIDNGWFEPDLGIYWTVNVIP